MPNSLSEKLPLLLDKPSLSNSILGIQSSLIFLLISIAWYFYASSSISQDRSSFLFPFLLIVLHSLLIILCSRNLLFQLRYALLLVIPLGTTISWAFFDDVFISPYGPEYQTFQATLSITFMCLLSLSGASLGWFIGFLPNKKANLKLLNLPFLPNIIFIHKASLISLYSVVSLNMWMLGGLVSSSKLYTEGGNDVPIGATNVLLFTSLAIFLVSGLLLGYNYPRLYLFITPAFLLHLLSGLRADYLMQYGILTLVFIICIFKRKTFSLRLSSGLRQSLLYSLLLIITAFILFASANLIAVWRHSADFEYAWRVFTSGSIFFRYEPFGAVLNLETANQMASHLYIAYTKLNVLSQQLLWGSGYLDYLPRSLPLFLGFERPPDLAWQMNLYEGEILSLGGIYEVAESYLNFSFLGCFLVPLFISRIYSKLLQNGYTHPTLWPFYLSCYISFALIAPRGIWYQTFAFWRTGTILLFLYLLIIIADFRLTRKSPT